MREVAEQSEAVVEADNLRFASPATMSRLSVTFLSEEYVDVKPAIAAWIAQQPLECQGSLATLFDSTSIELCIGSTRGLATMSLPRKAQLLAIPERPETMAPGQKRSIGKDEKSVITKTDFHLALCRGFAGNLPVNLRHTFLREVCKWAGESLETRTIV